MKSFNIVVCIIVLVLAIISAACSYFLYEKRVQFVDGWNQMSTAINSSAKIIDKHSEKKFASKLTPDTLSHKNYSNLGVQLKNLTAQSNAFVAQYEALVQEKENLEATLVKKDAELSKIKNQCQQMAVVFASISDKIGANAGSAADFSGTNYFGRINGLKDKVAQLFDSRESIVRELQAIGKREGFSIDKQNLFNNSRNGLAPVSSKIAEHKRARGNYAGSLRGIAGLVKAKFTDNGQVPAEVDRGVRTLNNQLNTTRNQLSTAQRTIGSLNSKIANLNSQIRNLNKTIDDRNRALNLPASSREPKVWTRGSTEARAAVVGKVTAVNKELGYIVLDFGKKTTVKQVVGNKELLINPDIEIGMAFSVTRNNEFIAEITLSKVGDNDATAFIPVIKNSNEIKVGDTVLFLQKVTERK